MGADPVAGRTALVAGATGLVGREILRALLADKACAAVHSVGRRALTLRHPKLQSHRIDFAAPGALMPVDDVYIALGTTIKVAGSQQAFRAVDLDAVVNVARAAFDAGATRLGVVSAMGADARSTVFYNRVKGEMEQAVRAIGYDRVVIVRPSMLAGDREALQQASRPAEKLGLVFMNALRPLIPANYRAINARDVALGLIEALDSNPDGVHIVLSGDLQRS